MQLADLRIFTEPQQGATYDTLLAVATRTEALGFGAFFRSDHYMAMGNVSGLPGPSDAWITLAGLARDTSSVRLGTLVSPATFRGPGQLAVSVANVDHMSGGRVELGLGAGWYEQEHTAYGIDFRTSKDRFAALEDQLAIITGLWSTPVGQKFSYAGVIHSLSDSPALPKPLQQPVPIIIGGRGKVRTPQLAAQYAGEFNAPFATVEGFTEHCARVRRECERMGRTRPMIYSTGLTACVGANEAEYARRARAIGRDDADFRKTGAAGTVAEVAEKINAYVAAGLQRIYLQCFDLSDLDQLDLIATEVAPLLAH